MQSNLKEVTLAPIVLFVYNRPWHTLQTLEALSKNELAQESILYVYADGPKDHATDDDLRKIAEVASIVHSKKWCKEIHFSQQKSNFGLANNIISGITSVVGRYGKIIVLEDDIVTSSGFLKFMNEGLTIYENEDKVMQISGFIFPVKERLPETLFLCINFCWGWGTWQRAWKNFVAEESHFINAINTPELRYRFDFDDSYDFFGQLWGNYTGTLRTWAVKWYASIFFLRGLALHPGKSMVKNIGLDFSGVHSSPNEFYKISDLNNSVLVNKIAIEESALGRMAISNYYRQSRPRGKTRKTSKAIKVFENIKLLFKLPIFLIDLYNNRNFLVLNKYSFRFKGSFISPLATFHFDNPRDISLGKGCYVGEFTTIWVVNYNENIKNSCLIIGENTYIGEQNNIRASGGKIVIGKNCLISQHVSMIVTGHLYNRGNAIKEQPWSVEKNFIIMGDDVWVGSGVQILPGVVIGNGAVIAAGSVVTKDVNAYSVVAGIPAKKIKDRI